MYRIIGTSLAVVVLLLLLLFLGIFCIRLYRIMFTTIPTISSCSSSTDVIWVDHVTNQWPLQHMATGTTVYVTPTPDGQENSDKDSVTHGIYVAGEDGDWLKLRVPQPDETVAEYHNGHK